MKTLSKKLLSIMAISMIAMLTFSSCEKEEENDMDVMPEPMMAESIVKIASETSSLSILVEALSMYPDLVDALSSEGDYTVFAPTNDAFAALLNVTGQTSLKDIPEEVIERVLKYHVISGNSIMSTDLSNGQKASTILSAEDMIEVSIDGGSVMINNAKVSIADIKASNGVVHVVDAVLVPALEASIVNTIVEPAYFNKNFSILTSAVVKADLLSTLINKDANFTLFAPDNAAFEAAGISSIDGLTAEDLAPILTYHVIGSKVYGDGLPESGSAVTTLGGDFYLSINSNGAYINGTTMITNATMKNGSFDYANGVVHLIDRTIVPASNNIVEIAVAASQDAKAPEFGQLVAALSAVENDMSTASLISILSGDGPFTVFAPTDAAFAALYEKAGVNDFGQLVNAVGIETIEAVLTYHVVGARVFSTDIPNVLGENSSANITTVQGGYFMLNSDYTITDMDAALGIGTMNANIVGTDIMGTNGVIHVIDQVVLP